MDRLFFHNYLLPDARFTAVPPTTVRVIPRYFFSSTFSTFCTRRAACELNGPANTAAVSWPQVCAGVGSLRRVSN